MIRVTHVISGLGIGGAETALRKLLSAIDRTRFDMNVISLTNFGPIGQRIESDGFSVNALKMSRQLPNPIALLRLTRWLKARSPDIVQTWMYHADLVGGLAAKFGCNAPVIWGIRHTNLEAGKNKRSTLLTARICARLSNVVPARIVAVSETTAIEHVQIGYAANRMVVIPNGFDSDMFRPDPEAKTRVRRELGLPDNALLIGLVARFDAQKDHETFIQAAAQVAKRRNDLFFMMCGDEITWQNPRLAAWINSTGITNRFLLLGQRDDMQHVAASLDVAVSSSCGEGLPNSIGEAMSCGVPCVVTDVGGSSALVGDTGIVVPARNVTQLAGSIEKLLALRDDQRRTMGLSARERIETQYGLARMANCYQDLYEKMVNDVRTGRVH